MRMRATLLMCSVLLGAVPADAQQADIGRHKHLGVGTCASSVCHGKVAAQTGRNVGLNEYDLWTKKDLHARAYRALEAPLSKRIAASLGLGNPTGEKLCLDCHADNVPRDRRGPKFQLTDGVSCEACHGGAERWIENHATASRTHKENVAEGMYPSALPMPRARLCVSCHLGSKDKFASHTLMTAGHPRLSFELEAYTTNQPAHFTVDADYKRRKGTIAGLNLWLAGQIESARSVLMLQRSEAFHPPQSGMFPDFALYDCQSCHHPMDRLRKTRLLPGGGLKPGALRLQTQNLVVLGAALEAVEPQASGELASLLEAFFRAGQRDAAALNVAAGALVDWVKRRESLTQRQFSAQELSDVREALLRYGASAKVGDYAVAEQIVLGVESLSYSAGDHSAKKPLLDKLFAAVKDGSTFNPAQFSAAAKAAVGRK